MAQIGDRRRPKAPATGNERPGNSGNPRERHGAEALVDRAATSHGGEAGDMPDAGRWLADRLIAGLDKRPFRPTADQLAWVWGGDLVRGEAPGSRARIAAGRYAALLTDHVVQDITIEGAPGAYARIWLCTRHAFIESVASEPFEPPSDRALSA
jgi:hypothetical protein